MVTPLGLLQNVQGLYTRAAARKTNSPLVGYIGGQGDNNLGDEAILAVTHQLLPAVKLLEIAFPAQERRLAQLKLSGRPYFKSVILGGGTLINPHWHEKVRTILDQNVPMFALGTGVGSAGFGMAPLVNIQEWKPLLSQFLHIGVRGPQSASRLEEIGIENVDIIGDLALSLTQNHYQLPATPPEFTVNVSRSRSFDPNGSVPMGELEAVIQHLVSRGWIPKPVAMHYTDREPLRQLMESATGSAPEIFEPHTADEFFRIVSPCTFTVAVRLHAAILSCCVGVPPLMLGYRDKCSDFMQSMELDEWNINLDNNTPGVIPEKVYALAEVAPQMRPQVLEQALSWRGKIRHYISEVTATMDREAT